MGYRVSRSAELDILGIFFQGLDDFGIRRAERYRDELKNQFRLIGEFPNIARLRTGFPDSIRALPHRSHVILYEHDGTDVVILRVRHGREDWLNDPMGDSANLRDETAP